MEEGEGGAVAWADVFFGSLLFDYDQVSALNRVGGQKGGRSPSMCDCGGQVSVCVWGACVDGDA